MNIMTDRRRMLIRLTTPVGMGYIPTGFAFGVLADQAGLPWALVVAMSIFVFAGSLQFAMIPMLAGASGLGIIALSTVLINLRHVFYAMPLIDHLPRGLMRRAYGVATLTDENYSVLTTMPEKERQHLWPLLSLINHAYWIGGTVLGALFGHEIAQWIPNLDFALPALFTILAIEQYSIRRQWGPIAIGMIAYLVGRILLPDFALISALGVSLCALLPRAIQQRRIADAP